MRIEHFFTTLLFFLAFNQIKSQVVGQDSNGFSSIIEASASINLDVTNNITSITYYQDRFKKVENLKSGFTLTWEDCQDTNKKEAVSQCYRERWDKEVKLYKELNRPYITWGFELKGKSSDGISTILRNEEVASGGSAGIFLGLNTRNLTYREKRAKKIISLANKEIKFTRERTNYVNIIENELDNLKRKNLINIEKQDKIRSAIDVKFDLDYEKQMKSICKIKDNFEYQNEDNDKPSEKRENYLKSRLDAIDDIKSAINNVINEIKDTTSNDDNRLKLIFEFERTYDNYRKFELSIALDNAKLLDTNTWTTFLDKLNTKYNITKYDLVKEKIKSKNTSSESFKFIIKLINNYINFLKKNKEDIGAGNRTRQNLLYAVNTNLFYTKVAFTGSSFTFDSNPETNTIDERFEKREFQGYRAELGFTTNFWLYNYLGLNFAVNRTDNTSSLLNTTYNFKNIVEGLSEGTLTTSREIQALSGEYRKFLRYDLSLDYAILIPFKNNNSQNTVENSSELLLSINPYFRHNFYGEGANLKPSTAFGTGVYAFKTNDGTVAGGVFLQLNDLFDNNTLMPQSLTEKVNFGVVVRANIKSLNPTKKK